MQMSEEVFDHYFSLEEAAGLIPEVTRAFEKAHVELNELKDGIILMKRIQVSREQAGLELSEEESEVMRQKWKAYEECFNKWLRFFLERHILLRDLDRGLIDFPYRAGDGREYLLCWQIGEDGLFYFHDTSEGFAGRRPITLLPD
jgi:hypothetical protein